MRFTPAILLLAVLTAGCAQPGGPFPSLAPRPAEAVDPRLPVEVTIVELADPELEFRLANLVRQARSGQAEFQQAIDVAQRLAAEAGAPQSESWIAAQQALSSAVEARAPVTRALGDIDELAAEAIIRNGGLGPGARATIRSAQVEVAAIDQRQAQMISALQARLTR